MSYIKRDLIQEFLRSEKLYNDYELLKRFGERGRDVMINFAMRGSVPMTHVSSPTHYTDPGACFFNNGRKRFVGKRQASVTEAKEWVAKKYEIFGWLPSPFDPGVELPSYVMEQVNEFVRGGIKEFRRARYEETVAEDEE